MKARLLQSKIWKDSFFCDLTSVEKMLFIYYLTNEKINIIHCYEITDREVMFDTGVSRPQLDSFKEKAKSKLVFNDDFCFIVNGDRYQSFTGAKNDKQKEQILSSFPPKIKEWYISVLDRGMNTPMDTPTNTPINRGIDTAPIGAVTILNNNKKGGVGGKGFDTVTEEFAREFAKEESLYPPSVVKLIPKWRDHHKAKKTRIYDYKASFRTWVRREVEWGKLTKTEGTQQTLPMPSPELAKPMTPEQQKQWNAQRAKLGGLFRRGRS